MNYFKIISEEIIKLKFKFAHAQSSIPQLLRELSRDVILSLSKYVCGFLFSLTSINFIYQLFIGSHNYFTFK